VKPMTKEIPADHQVFSPAASQIIHIRPVSAAIVLGACRAGAGGEVGGP
jgi:Na+/citrate or Na+/malate symporter